MSKPAPLELDVIQIASPCSMDWNSMEGDARRRHCGQCKLPVYNLAELTREQATELIAEHEGTLCVRLYRRADGTVLTRDCPVGLRELRRRLARGVAAVVAMVAALAAGVVFGKSPSGSWSQGAYDRLSHWFEPPQMVMGSICILPPTPAPPVPNGMPPAPEESGEAVSE